MCSVRTESCCSIWLNCLSGSMQTDNCLDPPAHKLESTRLFPWGSHFSLVGNLSRKWFGSLSVGIVVVYGRSLSYYSVAHQLPGPSWQILHLRCIPRFCWKNFPIKTSSDIESRAPSVTIWNRKWANLVLFIDNWNRIAPNFALVETPNSNDCKSP